LKSGAPLLRFFGLYYTATSLLIFLVQTFITKFVLQHAGLAATASALPVTLAAGGFAALLIPGFTVLSGVRGMEILMRGSLFRSAYELFFTAVAPPEKRAVKSIIDVGLDRMGDAVGAGIVSLFLFLAPGQYHGILLSVCACSAMAFLLAMRLRTGYVSALEKSLVERAIELDPAMVEDSTTRSLLMQTLVAQRPPSSPEKQAAAPPPPAPPAPEIVLLTEIRDSLRNR
jgi:ATP/ADP translocase